MEINRWRRPKTNSNSVFSSFFLCVSKNMHSGVTQKAPPLFSPPAFSLLLCLVFTQTSEVRAQRKEFTFKKEGQAKGGGRSRADWEAGSVLSWPRRAPAGPSGLLLNVGWDTTPGSAFHPTALSLSPSSSFSSPSTSSPLRSACPAVSLPHCCSLCLPLTQSVREWAQSTAQLLIAASSQETHNIHLSDETHKLAHTHTHTAAAENWRQDRERVK